MRISEVYLAIFSVRSFADRIANMSAQLAKTDFESVDWIFEADASSLNGSQLEHYNSNKLRLSEISLIEKNKIALRRFLESERPVALLFEDDAIFFRGFNLRAQEVFRAVANLPAGFVVTLGGSDDRVDYEFLAYPDELVPRVISTAEALLIDRKTAIDRLAYLEKMTIDLPLDHLWQKYDLSVGLNHYWVKAPLVGQGSQSGFFSSQIDGKRAGKGIIFRLIGYARHLSKRVRKRGIPYIKYKILQGIKMMRARA